jgi:hypothetical protein
MITKRRNKGVISILLHALASSGMTTKAIGKSAWPMDAFRFVAKLPHKVVVHRLRTQGAAPSDYVAISARARSRGSEDKITMGIQYLISGVANSNRPSRFGMSHHTMRDDNDVEREHSC